MRSALLSMLLVCVVAAVCVEGCMVGTGLYGSQCVKCPKGTYKGDTKMNACYACPAGQACPDLGMTAGVPCKPGTGSPGASSSCYQCRAGTFAAAAGTKTKGAGAQANLCPLCIAGEWSATGATKCNRCNGGTFSKKGSDHCEQCAAGTYAFPGSGQCVKCPGGFFAAAPGAKECKPCPAGQSGGTGATKCSGSPLRATAAKPKKATAPKAKGVKKAVKKALMEQSATVSSPSTPIAVDPRKEHTPPTSTVAPVKPPSGNADNRAALVQDVLAGCRSVSSCDQCVSSSTNFVVCNVGGTYPHKHYACCQHDKSGDRKVVEGSHINLKKGAKAGESVAKAEDRAADANLVSNEAWEIAYVASQFPAETLSTVRAAIAEAKSKLNGSEKRSLIMDYLTKKFAKSRAADARLISSEEWETSYVANLYPAQSLARVRSDIVACKKSLNSNSRAKIYACLDAKYGKGQEQDAKLLSQEDWELRYIWNRYFSAYTLAQVTDAVKAAKAKLKTNSREKLMAELNITLPKGNNL